MESYRQFFLDAGYPDVKVSLADGRIPCAVAVMRKRFLEKQQERSKSI